jgi:hypothetical protein
MRGDERQLVVDRDRVCERVRGPVEWPPCSRQRERPRSADEPRRTRQSQRVDQVDPRAGVAGERSAVQADAARGHRAGDSARRERPPAADARERGSGRGGRRGRRSPRAAAADANLHEVGMRRPECGMGCASTTGSELRRTIRPVFERFERAVSDRRYDGLRPRPLITSRIVGESGGTDVAAKRARRGLDVHCRSAASRRRPPVERAREARPRRTEPRKHEEDTKNTQRTRRFFVSLRDSSPRSRIGP